MSVRSDRAEMKRRMSHARRKPTTFYCRTCRQLVARVTATMEMIQAKQCAECLKTDTVEG